jgi:indole-3-glycerol phosphate synthase
LPPAIPDILARIVSRKREELREASTPARTLRQSAEIMKGSRRDFAAALRSKTPAIISEIKQASPSKGILIEHFNPPDLARSYERGGACALSVLTDRDFFLGSLDDLAAARGACQLPVLRKDFTIAEYHVLEAAAAGADAILLIAAILEESEMRGFRQLAAEFGIAALAEAHNEAELEKSLSSGAEIVGINNRDLRTFEVSLETSIALAPKIPAGILKVSESGILDTQHIQRLTAAGYNAFLVGERLMRSEDATLTLRELVA